jgi:hypothetical protein
MSRARIAVAVALTACLSGARAEAGPITGPILNPANGHDYYLLSPNNATGAEADAVQLGGFLATVRNQAENDWLYNTFGDYGGVHRLLWIGLHDVTGTFDWQWYSGEPFVYNHWSSTEPNSEGVERFVYMYGPGWQFDFPVNDRRPSYWNNYRNVATEFVGTPPFGATPIYGIAEVVPTISTTVPEPSSVAMLSVGLASLIVGYARRRQNRRSG